MQNCLTRASTIIRKIITKDPGYGILYHNIDRQKVEVDLEWINDLISRSFSVPEWANEPDVGGSLSWVRSQPASRLLLRDAIRMMPLIKGTVDVNYYTPKAWDRFIIFGRNLLSVTEPTDKTVHHAVTVSRYMVCDFPKQCALNKSAQLTVRLDITPPEQSTPAPEVELEFGPNENQVDLLVLVKAPGFQISDYYVVCEYR